MSETVEHRVTEMLRAHDGIDAAWLFGSVASGTADSASDLDVAVLSPSPLEAEEKATLIEQLAQITGRPIDLIDLQATHAPVVGQILRNGTRLFCDDTTRYAELLNRWWFDPADWMPYRRRILRERRPYPITCAFISNTEVHAN